MRSFVALPLDEDTEDALARLQEDLPVGRPVDIEALHLTLAFLEDQDATTLDALHEGLMCLTLPRLNVRITGLEVHTRAAPRLLVAEIADCPDLRHLQQKISQVARDAGIHLPRRRFRPHITLARFGRAMPAHEQRQVAGFLARHGAFQLHIPELSRFALYRSDLMPEGPIYTELADYPLTG